MPDRAERDLDRLAPLAEPLRRAIYLYVVGKRDDVGRDEIASVFDIGRSLAAFHLDKLLEHGLLEAGYRRLSGLSGPGAGRPAKVYRVAGEIDVNVPHRDYEFAARLLAEASRADPRREGAVDDVAFEAGRAVGREAAGRGRDRGSPRRRLTRTLADRGYEPYTRQGEVRLRNCPFHALATEYRDTICPMNLSFIRGILDGLGAQAFEAFARDADGECCVAVRLGDGRSGDGSRKKV